MRLELLRPGQVAGEQHGLAVVAPGLLVAAGPAVALGDEALQRGRALLGVDRHDVVAHGPAGEQDAQRQVGVLGHAVRVPAAEAAQRACPYGTVGAAVRRQLEQRLAPVLVDDVAGEVVDGDGPGEPRLDRVADDAATLHGVDVRVDEVADQLVDHVAPRDVVGVEDDDDLAAGLSWLRG